MRRKVPFVGEEHIARAPDDQADAKRTSGRVIDDVLSTHAAPSSWEDVVVVDKPAEPPKAPRISASVSAPNIPRHIRHSAASISSGSSFKKAVIESSLRASIDWVPINNGHALRINVCGNLDQNIREEWRRMLDETAGNGVGQFEFNMTQAPNISLTGLGMLLMFKEQKGSERGDIKLCHCSREVWQILEWTGMDKYFTIQGSPNPNVG